MVPIPPDVLVGSGAFDPVKEASAPETLPSNVLSKEQICRMDPTRPGRSDVSSTSVWLVWMKLVEGREC